MYNVMQNFSGGMMGWGSSWGLVFWISTLLFWAVLVLLIVALWRYINKK